MINPTQLREHIIRPALQYLDSEIPYTIAAEKQVIGTCAQESGMGEFLVQGGGGPALGIFQMEPATHYDHYDNYLCYAPIELMRKIKAYGGSIRSPGRMVFDLRYAAIMCRIHYWRVAEPLPKEDDVEGMAHYYKAYYNTVKGKATVKQFIDNYKRYVT